MFKKLGNIIDKTQEKADAANAKVEAANAKKEELEEKKKIAEEESAKLKEQYDVAAEAVSNIESIDDVSGAMGTVAEAAGASAEILGDNTENFEKLAPALEKAQKGMEVAQEKTEGAQENFDGKMETYENTMETKEKVEKVGVAVGLLEEEKEEEEGQKEQDRTSTLSTAIGSAGAPKGNSIILTPLLPLYQGGSMFIELDNAAQSIQIGSMVSGKIRANIDTPFPARSLSISIRGYQRADFKPVIGADKFEASADAKVKFTKTIIDQKFVIEDFDTSENQSGMLEYPFTLKVPEWLQPSVMCQFEDSNLSVTYYLFAQFDAEQSDLVANAEDGTSVLRADCTIYLYKSIFDEEVKDQSLAQEETKSEPRELQKKLDLKVGGMLGIGTTTAHALVKMEKTNFHAGEGASVHIDMDNSTCAKPVKSYKFKLRRVIKCFAKQKIPALTKEEYLIEIKEEGCDRQIKHTKDYIFEIPRVDKNFGKTDSLHPELRQLVKMFSDSTTSSLFEINYFLDVFIKHQSKLEFGMGNFVSFPINIYQNETNISFAQQKSADWLASQNITDWQPHFIGAPSTLTVRRTSIDGRYTTEVTRDSTAGNDRLACIQSSVDEAAEMAKQLAQNQHLQAQRDAEEEAQAQAEREAHAHAERMRQEAEAQERAVIQAAEEQTRIQLQQQQAEQEEQLRRQKEEADLQHQQHLESLGQQEREAAEEQHREKERLEQQAREEQERLQAQYEAEEQAKQKAIAEEQERQRIEAEQLQAQADAEAAAAKAEQEAAALAQQPAEEQEEQVKVIDDTEDQPEAAQDDANNNYGEFQAREPGASMYEGMF